jgi:hypothetical protein
MGMKGVRWRGAGWEIRFIEQGKRVSRTVSFPNTPEGMECAIKIRQEYVAKEKRRRSHEWEDDPEPIPRNFYSQALISARKRGGDSYALTRDDEAAMIARAKSRCELTGIPFRMEKFGYCRSPFAPSVDRIDSRVGYTPRNTRLVAVSVNLALNEFGEKVLRMIAAALVAAGSQDSDRTNREAH